MVSLVPLSLLGLLAPSFAGSISAPGTIGGPDAGPATPNPAAIYYNPAAIGAAPGVQLLMDAQYAFIRVDAETTRNDGIDPNTGEAYNVAKARVQVPVAFIGATWKVLPKRLTLGFGVTDAFVGGGDYSAGEPNPDAPPYQSHQRYAGAVTKIVTFHLIPAAAVTIVEGVHVGGSFKYIIDTFDALQAADPLGTEGFSATTGPYTTDTVLEGSMAGHHFGWAAGLFIDRWKLAQVGLSYTDNGVFHAEGEGSLTVPAFLSTTQESVTVPASLTLTAPLPPLIEVWVNSEVSDRVTVGAGAEIQMWGACCGDQDDDGDGDVDGDILITVHNQDGDPIGPNDGLLLEVAQEQYSPRRLENSFNLAANVGWKMNDAFWFGARAGYNQNAVPDFAVSATNIDYTSVGAVLAARYTLGKVTFGLSYSKFIPFERTITNSAWMADKDSADYVDNFFTPDGPPYKASTNGTYKAKVDIVGVRVAAKF